MKCSDKDNGISNGELLDDINSKLEKVVVGFERVKPREIAKICLGLAKICHNLNKEIKELKRNG